MSVLQILKDFFSYIWGKLSEKIKSYAILFVLILFVYSVISTIIFIGAIGNNRNLDDSLDRALATADELRKGDELSKILLGELGAELSVAKQDIERLESVRDGLRDELAQVRADKDGVGKSTESFESLNKRFRAITELYPIPSEEFDITEEHF